MNVLIRSKRVEFDIFTKNKVNNTYKKWMNDKDITKFIIKSNINTISSLKEFVDKMSDPNNFFFRVIHIKTNQHIGNVRIGPLSYKRKCSGFGLMIGNKEFHNKGYGKEITNLAVDFLFKFLNFKKIEFSCYKKNIPAIKLYNSLNFKKKNKSSKMVIFYKLNER
tara:strand:+ start:7742 stop:8236 length:495 start_codon:yes stop_codon:yes gene_type:complete